MHFKWIFVISSCLILSASSARREGGGGGGRSRSVSRGATSVSRPATVAGFSGTPRFASSPSLSGRGPRTNTLHTPRAASAPPLSSLPESSFPNSFHTPTRVRSRIPRPPPLPPTGFSNPPGTSSRIPQPPPLPPKYLNSPPAKNSGSAIPPAPPQPSLSPKSNLPKNVPKRTPGKNSPVKNSPPSQAVITPVVVSPIMTIPSKRNSTTNGKSSNPNKNLGKAVNSTAQPLQAGTNSTGGGFKNDINLAKGSAVNSTIKGSPKNTTMNLGLNSNNSGRNVTETAKLNGTINGFPQVLPGINSQRNFTLSSSGMKANHTTHNNTRNATGIGFQGGVGPISQTQTSPIAKFPWETTKSGNSQKAPGNNMTHLEDSVQKYDVNNGDAPRKPRNDVVGDVAKKIVKSVASKQNSGAKTAKSGLSSQSWDANRNENSWKSSVNNSPLTAPSKIMNCLIAAGVIVYFLNRK